MPVFSKRLNVFICSFYHLFSVCHFGHYRVRQKSIPYGFLRLCLIVEYKNSPCSHCDMLYIFTDTLVEGTPPSELPAK